METFRIHPAIGIARVGNSEDYVIAPESMAGTPVSPPAPLVSPPPPLTGGLPISPASGEPVRSGDVRDAEGALKRQAARFRIFAYQPTATGAETWPRGDGTEIVIGSTVNGKAVKDIIWTVHLANKKANNFVLMDSGIDGYLGTLPPIRNTSVTDPDAPQPPDSEKIQVLGDPARVRQLTIDPGPRAISGAATAPVRFDKPTAAAFYDAARAQVVTVANYPKSFPADSFPDLDEPAGAIDTLGELLGDGEGRLLVVGGYGRAVGWRLNGVSPPLPDDVNNNQWFDDASDGPVSAVIVFDDGTSAIPTGAWVTATDPSFAPQILNVVSLWDDIFDCWIRDRVLNLVPTIFDPNNGGYQQSYQPTFNDQLAPIFQSPVLQQWVVNLNGNGIGSHAGVGAIAFGDAPNTTPIAGLGIFRLPNNPPDQDIDPVTQPLMPLHLGDGDGSFLTLRQTQLFFLQRWNQGPGNFVAGAAALGPGEYLDKASLVNCLGGRFSPGIDLTYVMREPSIYNQAWQTSGGGPFRVNAKTLAYASVSPGAPLLGVGYVPGQNVSDTLEPGDLSKFMALPWHTDYNSCATHTPSPNPPVNNLPGATRVFWSWPAQRPVAVFTAADALQQAVPIASPPSFAQRWSVRGPGTDSNQGDDWGRYQQSVDMLTHWHEIGVVMQATQVDPQPTPIPADWYVEVESQLVDTGNSPVFKYPNFAGSPGHKS